MDLATDLKADMTTKEAEDGMSIEIEDVVRGAFRAILGREIDDGNLQQATASIAAGLPIDTFLTSMLTCPEYLNKSDRREFTTFTPVAVEIDGRRLWIDLSDTFVSRVCMGGTYEPDETAFVRAHLKEGDTFLDVGANIGWFTTLAAQLVGPSGRVHAFEPRNETRSLLERSISDGGWGDRVSLHDVIVTERSGSARLVWNKTGHNPGGTRVLPDGRPVNERMVLQEASSIALDDMEFANRVSLIKMDIEGSEGLALRGARRTIERHQPVILTEVSDVALQRVSGHGALEMSAFMKSLDYSIRSLVHGRMGPEIDEADLIREHPFNVILLPRR